MASDSEAQSASVTVGGVIGGRPSLRAQPPSLQPLTGDAVAAELLAAGRALAVRHKVHSATRSALGRGRGDVGGVAGEVGRDCVMARGRGCERRAAQDVTAATQTGQDGSREMASLHQTARRPTETGRGKKGHGGQDGGDSSELHGDGRVCGGGASGWCVNRILRINKWNGGKLARRATAWRLCGVSLSSSCFFYVNRWFICGFTLSFHILYISSSSPRAFEWQSAASDIQSHRHGRPDVTTQLALNIPRQNTHH